LSAPRQIAADASCLFEVATGDDQNSSALMSCHPTFSLYRVSFTVDRVERRPLSTSGVVRAAAADRTATYGLIVTGSNQLQLIRTTTAGQSTLSTLSKNSNGDYAALAVNGGHWCAVWNELENDPPSTVRQNHLYVRTSQDQRAQRLDQPLAPENEDFPALVATADGFAVSYERSSPEGTSHELVFRTYRAGSWQSSQTLESEPQFSASYVPSVAADHNGLAIAYIRNGAVVVRHGSSQTVPGPVAKTYESTFGMQKAAVLTTPGHLFVAWTAGLGDSEVDGGYVELVDLSSPGERRYAVSRNTTAMSHEQLLGLVASHGLLTVAVDSASSDLGLYERQLTAR
jgi:hypothetical protein